MKSNALVLRVVSGGSVRAETYRYGPAVSVERRVVLSIAPRVRFWGYELWLHYPYLFNLTHIDLTPTAGRPVFVRADVRLFDWRGRIVALLYENVTVRERRVAFVPVVRVYSTSGEVEYEAVLPPESVVCPETWSYFEMPLGALARADINHDGVDEVLIATGDEIYLMREPYDVAHLLCLGNDWRSLGHVQIGRKVTK